MDYKSFLFIYFIIQIGTYIFHEQNKKLFSTVGKALRVRYDFRMVVNNFKSFKTILDDQRVAFTIHGRLVKEKLVFVPSMRIIILTFTRALNNVLNKPKFIPRWLRNSNIRCPHVKDVATGKMHLPYSFYEHGVKNRKIVYEIQKECYESIEAIMARLEKTGKR